MTLAEPLRFRPLPFPKVWGGDRLEPFLGVSFPDHPVGPVGEVWQLVDRDGTSSTVEGGSLDGRSLSGLMLSERESVLGDARPSADGHFPLLVKLLDASMPLSVQVHPDARTAERLGGEAKDECWYVLDAAPDGVLYLGLRPGVDAKTFAGGAGGPRIVDMLQPFDVSAGQFVAVPAGTVHAIGSGVTLVEVQENADTTYRLFDWDRVGLDGRPRELHLESALQSVDFETPPQGPVDPVFETDAGVNERALLWTNERFHVECLRVHDAWERDTLGLPTVYTVLGGRGALRAGEGVRPLKRGQTWLLPAAVGTHRFEESDGELSVLAVQARP